jgi:hypothetical protein
LNPDFVAVPVERWRDALHGDFMHHTAALLRHCGARLITGAEPPDRLAQLVDRARDRAA